MKTSEYTMITIEPELSENYLTQNSQDTLIQDRIFSKKIYLAINDNASNYKEITNDEYNVFQVELKEKILMKYQHIKQKQKQYIC